MQFRQASRAEARLELVKTWILMYWATSFHSPSMDELAAHFKTSKSVVFYWLEKFERDGWIEPRTPGQSRNIIPARVAGLLKTLDRNLPNT
jgi:hypothetical protein